VIDRPVVDILDGFVGGTKVMVVARCITATAFLAGLALGLAAPAGAAPAPFPADFETNAHYTETQINPKTNRPFKVHGHDVVNDWYFSPCGDGCASAARTPGEQPLGQANLVNGQWVLDTTDGAECPDGTSVPDAIAAHRTWDPNTLAGTVQTTGKEGTCGFPAGDPETADIQLALVP
jgi:hypothetical protein